MSRSSSEQCQSSSDPSQHGPTAQYRPTLPAGGPRWRRVRVMWYHCDWLASHIASAAAAGQHMLVQHQTVFKCTVDLKASVALLFTQQILKPFGSVLCVIFTRAVQRAVFCRGDCLVSAAGAAAVTRECTECCCGGPAAVRQRH